MADDLSSPSSSARVAPVWVRVLPSGAFAVTLLAAAITDLPYDLIESLWLLVAIGAFCTGGGLVPKYPVQWFKHAVMALLIVVAVAYLALFFVSAGREAWTGVHILGFLAFVGVTVMSAHPHVAENASTGATLFIFIFMSFALVLGANSALRWMLN